MGVKEVFVAVVVAAFAGLVRSEAEAWMPAIVRVLKRWALSAFSGALKERLDEEWEANLLAVPGMMSRVVVALGFCWAAITIRSEMLQAAIQKRIGMVVMGYWMNLLLVFVRTGFGWLKLRTRSGGKLTRLEVYLVFIPSLGCVLATVRAIEICVKREYFEEKDVYEIKRAIAEFSGRIKGVGKNKLTTIWQ